MKEWPQSPGGRRRCLENGDGWLGKRDEKKNERPSEVMFVRTKPLHWILGGYWVVRVDKLKSWVRLVTTGKGRKWKVKGRRKGAEGRKRGTRKKEEKGRRKGRRKRKKEWREKGRR